ncbi:MAG: hypothetical protein NDI60_11195 [Elusimicrobiales bacterium]|nr:hypothetical protein [Elusimicrobiales bacterium]
MTHAARPGQTLIEVVMATMIAAMTTTAVFSVILSSFVSGAKADKRDAAAMVLRRAQQTLNSYVSAEPWTAAYSAGATPGIWAADSSGVWALRNGVHDITSLLTGTSLSGTGASFTYTVASNDCGFGLGPGPNLPYACKTVTFSLIYPD